MDMYIFLPVKFRIYSETVGARTDKAYCRLCGFFHNVAEHTRQLCLSRAFKCKHFYTHYLSAKLGICHSAHRTYFVFRQDLILCHSFRACIIGNVLLRYLHALFAVAYYLLCGAATAFRYHSFKLTYPCFGGVFVYKSIERIVVDFKRSSVKTVTF